ncbi:deoxyribodipyrimidine photo-lyase-like isoform X2 [Macrobrachium rosenbergii]|uniref:deoxyribodipyrimidine photo-lyase-like isoform X2 n=2 Tax=Macrobrachium rosenbergii TaxID=79674 RepID=UPI0034D46DD1
MFRFQYCAVIQKGFRYFSSNMPLVGDIKIKMVRREEEVVRDIHTRLVMDRISASQNILDFNFDMSRVEHMNKVKDIPKGSTGVVYWMSRDQRVQDNWAVLFAQQLALNNKISLHVAFCLVPKFLDATYRHFYFLLKGLEEVERECQNLGIGFHLLLGEARTVLPEFIKNHNIGCLVTDFAPLRVPEQWRKDVKAAIPGNIPMFMVDAHNIIPCWITSSKLEQGAMTIRPKVHEKLSHYLTKFPPVVAHPYKSKFKVEPVDWVAADNTLEIDRTVEPVEWAVPGTKAGLQVLDEFCSKRMYKYGEKANDPNDNARSELSPWLHFGQVSTQRTALEARRYRDQIKEGVDAFIEQMVVRRELADNFCYYQKNYDNLDGAFPWARNTLEYHRLDKRRYIYSRELFHEGKTHDELWNAGQIELMKHGKMHGYVRIYWAKKILEWSASPEEALATAIYLNDRYNLDGRDPNGYTGIMWCICGVHDRQFPERPIYGKVRYVGYEGYRKRFNVDLFVSRYGARKHRYNPPY